MLPLVRRASGGHLREGRFFFPKGNFQEAIYRDSYIQLTQEEMSINSPYETRPVAVLAVEMWGISFCVNYIPSPVTEDMVEQSSMVDKYLLQKIRKYLF